MKKYYHARNEDALKQGSFFIEYRYKRGSSWAQYMLGDFHGWRTEGPPAGSELKVFTAAEARKVRAA